MAGGTFIPGVEKVRPGSYIIVKSKKEKKSLTAV